MARKVLGTMGRGRDVRTVYGTREGFRVGLKGELVDPGVVYGKLQKGEARKIRKAARRAGLKAHAAAPTWYVAEDPHGYLHLSAWIELTEAG